MSRREQLEQMLSETPDDTFLRYALAMECVSAGDDEAALAGFDDVLGRDPDYVAAWFQKGQLLAQQEQTESARAVLTQGIATADRVGDTHAAGEMREFLATLPDVR